MIYLDGTALMRFLPGVRYAQEWQVWVAPRLSGIVTTQLGFTEMRQAAELYPRQEKAQAFHIIEQVKKLIPVIRFSDENVGVSTHAAAVLPPFAALHLGAAVADPGVDTIVTYDAALAQVAEIYQLAVVTPGMPAGWHNGVATAFAPQES